jgi:hypothetical protein
MLYCGSPTLTSSTLTQLSIMSDYEKGGKDEHVENIAVPSEEQITPPLDEKADRRLVRKLDWNLLP